MEDGISQQLLIILALIIANGYFAMTEMSIVSAKKARLETKADEGDKGALAALSLAKDPNSMLSSVQIGITLISIITGLYGGAALSTPLSDYIKSHFSSLAEYADSMSPFIIVAGITFLSLILGELVPKRIALNSPERIAISVARPMRIFAIIAKPLVSLLSLSTALLLKVLGIQQKNEAPVTEDEIKVMLDQGAAVGAFEQEEPELVDNIFHMADMNVGDVMTPRPQLEWLDLDMDDDDLRVDIIDAHHFRLPVGRDSLDELVGIVSISDIFRRNLETHNTIGMTELIESCIKKPLIVPETVNLVKVLTLFREEGVHEAIVLDEFGGVSGFVTLHDILEEIVGLMPSNEDERKEEENRIIQRDENTWYIDGLLNISEFKEYFEIEYPLPGEEDDLYKTIGGFVTYMIGRIPKETDTVVFENLKFEVCDMDNTRVDKVIFSIEPIEDEEKPEA